MTTTLLEKIAVALDAYKRCVATMGDETWIDRWDDRLLAMEKALPSGSGIDQGTKIMRDMSRPDKLVLYAPFHHMDENGFYDGWTEHYIFVRPAFVGGFTIDVKGRNRNDIKDYLSETFHYVLSQPYEYAKEETK